MIYARKKQKVISYILLMVGIMLTIVLSGCGDNNADDMDIEIKPFEQLTSFQGEAPNVYLIIKALDNNYWDIITESVRVAAENRECNLYYSGSTVEAEWQAQVTLLDQAIEAGADAIIIAPDDSTKLAEPIKAAYEKGIPVVLIDTTITLDSYDVCYMTDNLMAGHQAAIELIYELEKSGYTDKDSLSIGIAVGSGSSQTISERLAGFSQYFTMNAPDSWKIISDIKINGGDIDLAEVQGNELLENHPDIKGVFGCNNGSTVGLARALAKSNRTDVIIVGFDYSDDIAALIDDENYTASTVLQRQDEMGRLSIDAVCSLIQGEKIGAKFWDTGIVIVNKETINEDEIQKVLELN